MGRGRDRGPPTARRGAVQKVSRDFPRQPLDLDGGDDDGGDNQHDGGDDDDQHTGSDLTGETEAGEEAEQDPLESDALFDALTEAAEHKLERVGLVRDTDVIESVFDSRMPSGTTPSTTSARCFGPPRACSHRLGGASTIFGSIWPTARMQG